MSRDQWALLRGDLAGAGTERQRRLHGRLVRADAALRALPEVRVYVADTPNLGHQAASLRIAERLVHEVGYRGRITLVYEDEHPANEPTLPKIARLHPHLADAGTREVAWGDAVVRALPISRLASLPTAELGITGGSELDATLLAQALRTRTLLVLQPFHWRWAVDRLAFADGRPSIMLADDDVLGHGFCERAYRVAPQPTPAFLRDAQQDGVSLGVVYGLRAPGVSTLDPTRALTSYAEMIVESLGTSSRRASLLLFDPIAPTCDIHDPRLQLVHVGTVPETAFVAAIAHATLPPLFEGQTTATIAVGAGVPYLQLADAGLSEPPPYARLPELPHAFADAVALSEAAAAGMHALAAGGGDAHDRRAVAAFLAQAALAESPLCRYAAALGAYYAVRGNDKLDIALMALTTLLPPAPDAL